MMTFLKGFFLGLMCICVFCSCSSREKHSPSKDTDSIKHSFVSESYTLSEKKLLDIIKQQDNLFADPNINAMGIFARSELKTKAMRIDSAWKSFFIDNPDNVDALILYGKFLRKIGQSAKAYSIFQRADILKDNIGVVKQQLSAIEAEEGSVKEAFAHISRLRR